MSSLSKPDRLARCFFRGLPTIISSALSLSAFFSAFGWSEGGVVARSDRSGGGDPVVGVFEAGDLRVAGEPVLSGSAECCRFSCVQLDHG